MFPSFTKDLKVIGGQGTCSEYTGERLKDASLLKSFKSIHKRAYGVLDNKEGAQLSDVLSKDELYLYKAFKWPKSITIDSEIAVEYCEMIPTINGPAMPDWVAQGLDALGIEVDEKLEICAICDGCDEWKPQDIGLSDIRQLVEAIEDASVYCNGSPRCTP